MLHPVITTNIKTGEKQRHRNYIYASRELSIPKEYLRRVLSGESSHTQGHKIRYVKL